MSPHPSLFTKKIFHFFIYWFTSVLGLFAAPGLSLVSMSGGCSLGLGVLDSPCGSFSCYRAWALGVQAQ